MIDSSTAAARVRRRRHPGWLRRLLLASCLLVVALTVVGMHQLSVRHAVATGYAGGHAHDTALGHDAGGPNPVSVAGAADAAVGPPGTLAGVGQDVCPGCGDHEMAFGSCLLALTLLVLAWTLVRPPRPLLPFLLPPPLSPRTNPRAGRLVPALSLTEMSLRRT